MDLQLTPAHWEIINLVQVFYTQYQTLPTMRALINYIQQNLDTEKATSIYVYTLFPDGMKQIALIAGLPKPSSCI